MLWLLPSLTLNSGGADNPDLKQAQERLAKLYADSRDTFLRDSNNVELGWQFGRACFDWADQASNNTQRAAIAREGIAACQQALAKVPTNAAAQYYLGLNLGQLALTQRLSALRTLGDIERAWLAAIAANPAFDYAGPHRSLGLLYRDAPGWPIAIGDNAKAKQHLKKAVELSPNYPDNQLYWLESLWEWGSKDTVRTNLAEAEKVLDKARLELTGPAWMLSWKDWDKRWQQLKAKADVRPASSPRQQ